MQGWSSHVTVKVQYVRTATKLQQFVYDTLIHHFLQKIRLIFIIEERPTSFI